MYILPRPEILDNILTQLYPGINKKFTTIVKRESFHLVFGEGRYVRDIAAPRKRYERTLALYEKIKTAVPEVKYLEKFTIKLTDNPLQILISTSE